MSNWFFYSDRFIEFYSKKILLWSFHFYVKLWSYMDAKMLNTKVTSFDLLIEVLHKEWLKIPIEYTNSKIHIKNLKSSLSPSSGFKILNAEEEL
ncbi:hypothetical protein BpHYR1_049264 [Brachionus plicatilis]|uniref:Uncharacterized protein n=1 Tax=Brachionus plicatilis TaxID=10195 RepID=A0A3M7R6U4_BRAPC|nr:hypothetical protein BpHYR1_049264 [Brachionus plicatilis]